jgi:hypothetical protein
MQPSTPMRQVAEACAHQVPGIEVKDVTVSGHLMF